MQRHISETTFSVGRHQKAVDWVSGAVAVLTAGTGDAAVAEECRRTAELMGCYVFRLQVPHLCSCYLVCFL